jgi:hypothetical protein
MQFTVLIEFLVPGLATTLLALFLLPEGAVQKLLQDFPTGETAPTLLLLAVSYPVGLLTNYPVFWLQRRLVSVNARRSIFKSYEKRGINLEELVNEQLGIMLFKGFEQKADNSVDVSSKIADSTPKDWRIYRYFHTKLSVSAGDYPKFKALFDFMSAYVFSKNIERVNAYHLFQEGLQRLARGMLLPLLLASIVVWKYKTSFWLLLIVFFIILAVSSYCLVRHSVNTEYEQLVRLFLVLKNTDKKAEKQSAHFAVCLNNEGYKASLEVGKLYCFIPDKEAEGVDSRGG